MNLLALVFIFFILLVIFLRIRETLKERQTKEERGEEETIEPTKTTERPIAVETVTTEATEPTERKRGIIPFLRHGGPGEFWLLFPIFLACLICFVYLLTKI